MLGTEIIPKRFEVRSGTECVFLRSHADIQRGLPAMNNFFRRANAPLERAFSASAIIRISKIRILALLFAVVVAASSSLVAQIGGTGSLQGTVADPAGAVVPGASVTATNVATNAT